MRSLGYVLLAAAIAIGTLGCGGKKGGAGGADGKKPLTIGVSVPAADHGWTAGIGYWAKEAMKAHPDIKWVYATANGPDKQIQDINDMMAQNKLDAIVVLATESAPLTPTAETIKQNRIFLVNVDRGFTKPVADVFLEGDNKAFGRKSAEFIAKKLDGKGKIVILRGIPCTVDTDRFEAGMEVFRTYPDIKVLNPKGTPGYWNRQKGLEVMQALLAQFPEADSIDAVWAQDDDMAEGAEQAIREAGRAEKIWIFGGAGKKDIIKRVMDKDPMYPGDITYPPAMIAAGIHAAVYKLGGIDEAKLKELVPAHIGMNMDEATKDQRHITLNVNLVTPENAKEYYFPDSPF